MPAMNTGLQRRIGRLPKTEDMLPSPKSLFGNSTHGGYMGRRPTPTSNGFFGLGSAHVSNEMGDGKLHIYGNDGVGVLFFLSTPLSGHKGSEYLFYCFKNR